MMSCPTLYEICNGMKYDLSLGLFGNDKMFFEWEGRKFVYKLQRVELRSVERLKAAKTRFAERIASILSEEFKKEKEKSTMTIKKLSSTIDASSICCTSTICTTDSVTSTLGNQMIVPYNPGYPINTGDIDYDRCFVNNKTIFNFPAGYVCTSTTEPPKKYIWPGEVVKYIDRIDIYNDQVVKMTFKDGTFTKAVCTGYDTFDIDIGITICLIKKMYGDNGHKKYNNDIRYVHKLLEKQEKEEQEKENKKYREREKKRKAELKKAAKQMKKRLEAIDIQKKAYVEAFREIEKVDGGE